MRTLGSTGTALLNRYLAGEKIAIVQLVHLALSTAQRWAIGGTEVVWDGHTWAPREIVLSNIDNEVGPSDAIQITLPGISDAERALAFSDVDGKDCNLYVALVDPDTAAADAVLVWSGQLDVAGWQAGRQSVVHYTAESMLAVALRPRVSRYTNEEQLRLYPGDTSLDVDPATDAAPLVWPAASYFRV